jgi:TonB family protein
MYRIQLSVVGIVLLSGAMMAQIPDPEAQLTIVKLQTPTYPAMAVAARVWGDVILSVTLSTDGTPALVTVDSGPPMLRQAAVESATHSRFQSDSKNENGPYRLTFKFVLDATRKCDDERDSSYPRVRSESNVITVAEQPVPICDPSVVIESIRFRSAKCLFLWKCGSRTP